ncbi:MAG TPA: hypothetical protein VFQ19_00910 [Nocardioidaceae bacterium]|nr:hypothetical protein [Nocardioidaceae bacterium]
MNTTTTEPEFVDLLCADDDWVRQEFEELVASGWGSEQPPSRHIAERRRRPSGRGDMVESSRLPRLVAWQQGLPARARQRSPPVRSRARPGG